MKCLTPNDLPKHQLWQHPVYGARTLTDIDEMEKLATEHRMQQAAIVPAKHIPESFAMYNRRENFIDQYGFAP